MANKCVHYWDIDSQNIGRCRKCGTERDFGKFQRRHGQGPVSLTKRDAAILRWEDEEYSYQEAVARPRVSGKDEDTARARRHNKLG